MRSTATAERRFGLTGSTQLIVHMDAFNRAATCVCVCVCVCVWCLFTLLGCCFGFLGDCITVLSARLFFHVWY